MTSKRQIEIVKKQIEDLSGKIFTLKTKFLNVDIKKAKYSAHLGRWAYIAKELKLSKNDFNVLKCWYDSEISYIDYLLMN